MLGQAGLQVVDGVAVDVLNHVGRHQVLESIPLVAQVLAAADCHVAPGHLQSLLLELLQPARLAPAERRGSQVYDAHTPMCIQKNIYIYIYIHIRVYVLTLKNHFTKYKMISYYNILYDFTRFSKHAV